MAEVFEVDTSIKLAQGQSWRQGIIYKRGGVAQDLSNAEILCEFRDLPVDAGGIVYATPTITKSTTVTGRFDMYLDTDSVNALIAAGSSFQEQATYEYDVYIVPDGGDSIRILNGYVYVSPRVTKPTEVVTP